MQVIAAPICSKYSEVDGASEGKKTPLNWELNPVKAASPQLLRHQRQDNG